MLIILEGMDGSGKSTLVDALAEQIDVGDGALHRLHSKALTKHPLEEYVLRLAEYDHEFNDIIADRWHIGELIYGPLYRGKSELTPAMRLYVDLFLQRQGALTLYLETPLRVVQHRLKVRGETFLKEQHHVLVHDQYTDECSFLNGWTAVPPSWRGNAELLNKLIEEARTRARDTEWIRENDSYVGPVNPDVLILGSRRDKHRVGRPRYKLAFVPYEDTSGHYLFSALALAPPSVSYGVAYAEDEDIDVLLERLGEPRILCLGRDAQSELLHELPKKPHTHLNHPEFPMRIPGSLHEYARLLKKAIDE